MKREPATRSESGVSVCGVARQLPEVCLFAFIPRLVFHSLRQVQPLMEPFSPRPTVGRPRVVSITPAPRHLDDDAERFIHDIFEPVTQRGHQVKLTTEETTLALRGPPVGDLHGPTSATDGDNGYASYDRHSKPSLLGRLSASLFKRG